MAGVSVDIRLKSIEKHVVKAHGSARSLTPAEFSVLSFWMEVLIQTIKNGWPVDTGTSRDRWEISAVTSFGDYAILIENPMYYAEWVHRSGSRGELWRTLIPGSWNSLKLVILAALRKKIDETEEKIAAMPKRFPDRSLREITLEFMRGLDA